MYVCINTAQHGLGSTYHSGVHIWNSLLVNIRKSHSLTNFKKKLNDYLSTYKRIDLANDLLVGARFHMTVFIPLLGICCLIY